MKSGANGELTPGAIAVELGVVICSRDTRRARALVAALSRPGIVARTCRGPTQISPIAEPGIVVLDEAGCFGRAMAACARMRRLCPGRPFLVVSNQRDTLERARLLEIGADLVLSEP